MQQRQSGCGACRLFAEVLEQVIRILIHRSKGLACLQNSFQAIAAGTDVVGVVSGLDEKIIVPGKEFIVGGQAEIDVSPACEMLICVKESKLLW